jgi:hypothetical protein
LPDILLFVLQVTATYRIGRLIAIDNGPFDCFLFVRLWLGRMAVRNRVAKTLADLVNCQFCIGVWVALFLALIFPVNYPWILCWLAIAGGQAIIADFVMKGEE